MLEYTDRLNNLFCISDDIVGQLKEERISIKEHATELLTYMLQVERGIPKEDYLSLLKQAAGRPEAIRLAILDAHAVSDTNQHYSPDEWRFFDRKPEFYRVQSWIDRYDTGAYTALLIYSCNPADFSVRARSSIVMHTAPFTAAAPSDQMDRIQHVLLPNFGYIQEFMAEPIHPTRTGR